MAYENLNSYQKKMIERYRRWDEQGKKISPKHALMLMGELSLCRDRVAELHERAERAEAWSAAWKRAAKENRLAFIGLAENRQDEWIRYNHETEHLEADNARLRAALLASLAVMRHVPHGQTLTDGEFVELQAAKRLAREALEGAP